MKNIFYVHSHITYFVTKAIIKKYDLSQEDIILVLSRNYKNIEIPSFTSIDITKIHDALDSFSITNFYKKHKYIYYIDSLLNMQLGNGTMFNAYLPHVFHPAMQIIASHKQCNSVNIIEEGVNAYSPYLMHNKDKSILKQLIKTTLNTFSFIGKKRIFFIKNFDLRKFSKKDQPVFYTVTSKGFKGIPHNIERIKMLPIKGLYYDISGSSILVLEGAVEQGNMKITTMLNGIEKIIKDIDGNKIFIKFHPAQSVKNINKIKELLERYKFITEFIPNEMAFEQIILTNKNLKIYGFTTSLLFYAHEYGCKTFSYEEYLANDSLFKVFRKKNNFDLKTLLSE